MRAQASLRDVLVDPLAELARVRREVEAFGLAAELHAVDHSCHAMTPSSLMQNPVKAAQRVSTLIWQMRAPSAALQPCEYA